MEVQNLDIDCQSTRRRVGHLEKTHLVMNKDLDTLFYTSVNIIESKRKISRDEVRNAFEEASKMNFLMRACVKSDDGQNYFFQSMSEEKLNSDWMLIDEISLVDGGSWEQVIPEILERKLDFENGPLWRVVWLKNASKIENRFSFTLVFFASHAISDGKAGFNLICNQIIPRLNGDTVSQKPIYFAKSQEEIFDGFNDEQLIARPMPMTTWLLGYTLSSLISWKRSLSSWLWGQPKPLDIHQHYNSFVIDEKENLTFIRACKSHQKSVNSVLVTLLYKSISDAKVKFGIKVTNSISFPLDLRKFETSMSNPNLTPMGNYHAAGTLKMFSVAIDDEEKFFKMVDEVMATTREFNKPRKESMMFNLFHILIENGIVTPEFLGMFPELQVTFSNLGNGDAVNKYDKDGSRDVVLKQHFFPVRNGLGFLVTTGTFRKELAVTVELDAKEELTEFNQGVSDEFKKNILKFVEIYG